MPILSRGQVKLVTAMNKLSKLTLNILPLFLYFSFAFILATCSYDKDLIKY